jgi:molybdenum cofactor cytidylyltransferase
MTFVSGLVLAAGGSKRLGQPKQLLPFGEATLLDHALSVARRCRFDQRLTVIGGGGPEVRGVVDLEGFDVVDNPAFGQGCSSSIAAALSAINSRADVLVLMLGDQPGVSSDSVAALIAGRGDADLAACLYDDGRGHPFAFSRACFEDLSTLHGDKGVWKLMDRAGDSVVDVRVPGPIPLDVDIWEDYEAVLAAAGLPTPGLTPSGRRSG